jgi:hypothetical protein
VVRDLAIGPAKREQSGCAALCRRLLGNAIGRQVEIEIGDAHTSVYGGSKHGGSKHGGSKHDGFTARRFAARGFESRRCPS